ncbi:hypothetical protein [Paenibacillus periandrae]|uniref:hypothetical protein n=1 Tax=Paenibacillus periandrae TaxID=1761741 RepID=UPI001F09876E|nr:hypothetical protein [Paenibacillus periandrae]
MSQTNVLHLYETLKMHGPPRPKSAFIESLQHEDAVALLKRVFRCVIADPKSFSTSQKFITVSLDYDKNLLYAEVSTGFKESIERSVDSTKLFMPKIKNFTLLLFKLPEETEILTESEAKKMVAKNATSGISPEDLFNNSERYELVHVSDISLRNGLKIR